MSRIGWLAVLSATLLQAQDGEVGWQPITMWQILPVLILVAVVLYGCWRLAKWLRNR